MVRKLCSRRRDILVTLSSPLLLPTDGLRNYFLKFGEVTDCIVMKDPHSGRSRCVEKGGGGGVRTVPSLWHRTTYCPLCCNSGFGFVTFKDASVCDDVLNAGPHELDSRRVCCAATLFLSLAILLLLAAHTPCPASETQCRLTRRGPCPVAPTLA